MILDGYVCLLLYGVILQISNINVKRRIKVTMMCLLCLPVFQSLPLNIAKYSMVWLLHGSCLFTRLSDFYYVSAQAMLAMFLDVQLAR